MPQPRFFSACLGVAILSLFAANAHGQGLKDATEAGKDSALSGQSLTSVISEVDESTLSNTGFGSLSLDKRVAQLMLVRLNGQMTPDNFDREVLSELPPGGVILPGISSPSTVIPYVNSLREAEIETVHKIPFLIGADAFTHVIDPEAGTLPSYLQLPSLMTLAAAGATDTTSLLLDNVSEHLHEMGINFHIGPSMALSNTVNPALGTINSLGDNPLLHAEFGRRIHKSFDKHGIAWLPLNFPGGAHNVMGDGPPVLLTPMSRLRKNDLLPYVEAIERGVDFVHVGNLLAPTLDDSGVPASLSANIMERRLRTDLEFSGIIVAGPMDGRLRSDIDPANAAVEAIRAGADMLLWNSNSPYVVRAIVQISMAAKSGDLDEKFVNAKVERVLALKEKLGLLEREPPKDGKANRLMSERGKWKSPRAVEQRSITLLRNRNNILPLNNESSLPLGLTGTLPLDHLYDVLSEDIKAVGKQPIKTARHTGRVEDFELDRLTRRVRGTRVTVCLFASNIDARSQVEIMRVLREGGSRVVAVIFGHPGNLAAYESADAILVMYGYPVETSDPSAVDLALGDVLLGRAPIEVLPGVRPIQRKAGQSIPFDFADVTRSPVGKLPISIPGLFEAGHSISYRPDPDYLKVSWDFGDGARSTEPRTEHVYTDPGSYAVTLTVDPRKGDTVSGTYEIIIE